MRLVCELWTSDSTDREESQNDATRMKTILSVAYPFALVGPRAVGGAEQILGSLEAGLVARGFCSIVVAQSGSEPVGELLATVIPAGVITQELRERVVSAHQGNIDLALSTNAVDLIHMHGIDFMSYRLPSQLPVLVTLHLPPSWYPSKVWEVPSNYTLQCVSEHQRLCCPAAVREELPVVRNGVALVSTDAPTKRRSYALMLSRICPEKNLHAGLDAAKLAGVPALLAGDTFPYEEHLRYLEEEIEPRLGDRARLLGPVGGAEKKRLLARAYCVLLPSLAAETSSLVAMEAAAAGTPVVAYSSGALPSIVRHGKTGFLVSDVKSMAAAIRRVGEIEATECRALASSEFSLSRMVDEYVDLYTVLLKRHQTDPGFSSVLESPRADPTLISEPRRSHDLGTIQELSVTAVKTSRELERLEPEWNSLWQSDSGATPFQSPEWLLPWWTHVGQGELHSIAVRDGGSRLVGLLPLYVCQHPVDGKRELLLMGAGTTDYLDGLFAADAAVPAERIAASAMKMIGEIGGTCDPGVLHQLRERSYLLRHARCARWEIFPSEPCSSVLVQGWSRLPPKIRLNSGRYLRRARSRGELTYGVAKTEQEAVTLLRDLISLHHKRWGDGGVLHSTSVRRHHFEAVPKLLAAGLLSLSCLKLDGKTVAVLYALIDPVSRGERRMYCYLIGFDPACADLSPGTLLLADAFERCEAQRISPS